MRIPLFTLEQPKRFKSLSCQRVCDALQRLLDNIFIRGGCFCYIISLSDNNQADGIEAHDSTS